MTRRTLAWIVLGTVLMLGYILVTVGWHLNFKAFRNGARSMAPAVRKGEQVIVRLTSDVAAGDIIAFRSVQQSDETLLSRLVATAGQTVEIRGRRLFINGKEIPEPYVFHDPTFDDDHSMDDWGPIVVPPKHYLTLGDNRANANDGRYWGPLPAKNVVGRVVLIYSPSGIRRPPASSRTPPTPPPG